MNLKNMLIVHQGSRVATFDNARALCMLYIVGWWHLQSYSKFGVPTLFNDFLDVTYGILGTFMFISGYFLAHKKVRSIDDALLFYWQRIIRIWPLYFIACTAFLLQISGGVDLESNKQYFLSLVGLSCIIPPAPYTLWFISMLISLYIITPLILFWQNKMRIAICVALFVLLVVARLLYAGLDERYIIMFPSYFFGLVYGSKSEGNFELKRPVLVMIISGMLFGGLSILKNGLLGMADVLSAHLFTIYPFIILIVAISYMIGCHWNWINKILYYISYASMCTYLFHRVYYGFLRNRVYHDKFSISEAYMIVLPTMLVIAFLIQRIYDLVIKAIKEKSMSDGTT